MSQHSAGPLHLISDAPIKSPGFDRLDRMAFVRSFAEAIRAVRGTDSVVLALAGPWGSGKSSLLNLVTGELRANSDTVQPLLMRFNPWWFTGTERLVAAFLQQLGAAVSRPEVKDLLGDATEGLDRLADAIARPGEKSDTPDPASRDIEVIRDNLNRIFLNSDRRILIFMDDIDRLTPEEMTQLLLILRAVADFPNTTFVLAYDHDVVCEAIANKLGVDGRTYLEKVIQLQIDVPLPGRMTLERMVVGQLEAIDPTAKSLDDEDQRQFRVLFEGGVKHFLATPRACTRLLNVLRFTYPTLAGQVYFPDMLGICCLMSFSPQAMQAIRSFSEAFVGHCDTKSRGWINLRKLHATWIAEIPKRDRSAVEGIVRSLFPKFAWALNGPLRGEDYLESWDQRKRICSVKHFDSYFRLGLSAGEAADHEWRNVIELLDDATAFARAMHRFGPLEDGREAGWVVDLLQQAQDFVNGQANSEQALSMFRAIMRRGDEIAAVKGESSEHLLKIEHVQRVVWVLVDCLLKVDDRGQRREALSAAVTEDAGLLTAAELLDALDYRPDIFAEGDAAPTAEENTAMLVEVLKILDGRIKKASENGDLAQHPLYMRIIQKWRQFGRKAMARKWVRSLCKKNHQRFVEALMQLCAVPLTGDVEDANAAALPIDMLSELFARHEMLTWGANILYEQPEWLTPEGTKVLELTMHLLRKQPA